MTQGFLALADTAPSLVLLEDAHWMDPASLEALRYLLPRQIAENGLTTKDVSITAAVLKQIINEYTAEAGVRTLERKIGTGSDKGAAATMAMVQEFVPGRGEGIFLLVDRGVVRAHFAHRRLREKPPAGGVSVVSESREPEPGELAACERLVAELGWHGVAMLEFHTKMNALDEEMMELLPRRVAELRDDPEVRCLVVTAAGDRLRVPARRD